LARGWSAAICRCSSGPPGKVAASAGAPAKEKSGRTGRGLAGWTGGIAPTSAKAGVAGARFGTVGPERPGRPTGGAPKERAPRSAWARSPTFPVGMPSAGTSGVVMVIAQQHVIEAGDRVLDQHGGREVAGHEVRGDRVVVGAHVAHRQAGLDLAGHAGFLQAD